jgi:hypothetical protein
VIWQPGIILGGYLYTVRKRVLKKQIQNSHIIVNLNLREHGNILRYQTEGNVSTAVTTATLDAGPILDTGQNHIDQLAQEVIHCLTLKLSLDSNSVAAGAMLQVATLDFDLKVSTRVLEIA